MLRPCIVVPDDFPTAIAGTPAEQRLRALGNVTVHGERGADQRDELIRRVSGAEIVVNIRAYSRFDAAVLDACERLRLISVWGTGTDHVDLEAARARGIAVTSTPGVNAQAVAEHTMGLILALARRIPAMDAAVRAGQWPRAELVQLEGKTLGVIGLGEIGRRVARLGAAFGMNVLASTVGDDAGRSASIGATHVSLETLLRESDVVSLHVRLSDRTSGCLDRARLGLMRRTAFLINTSRGPLVDRDALLDALRAGRIAGAALDVFHTEPLPVNDPLALLPNVVLTPHNAAMTPEVIRDGLGMAVENVAKFLA